MIKLINPKIIYPFVAAIGAVLVIVLFVLYKSEARQAKISEFGKYQGYSEATYDGNKRISDYLTLSNGTRLAYDLFLPTKKGIPADKPLPVLFKYTPYTRAFTIFDKDGKNIIADLFNRGWKEKAYLRVRYWFGERGNLMDAPFRAKYLENLLKHGYAVIVVERPGTGASFGVMNASFEVGAKEVDGKRSTYLTEGNLRASHRALSKAPYNNLGLPYHSYYQSDLAPIPASEPVELVFNLLPTSYRFHKGNRIRITVAFADADNFETTVVNSAPSLHLLRDKNHPSFIQLPIIHSR